MSWADAPVAGRRPCRWSSPIAGTDRLAPPRSAVAVSPIAPGLAPLTGFSRSGSPVLFRPALSRPRSATSVLVDLARVLRLGYGHAAGSRGTVYACKGGRAPLHRPPGLSQGPGGLFMGSIQPRLGGSAWASASAVLG